MILRFYFISDDELLSVLGSSGHEAVQPLMLKLFDNCKRLQIDGSGQVPQNTYLASARKSSHSSVVQDFPTLHGKWKMLPFR